MYNVRGIKSNIAVQVKEIDSKLHKHVSGREFDPKGLDKALKFVK